MGRKSIARALLATALVVPNGLVADEPDRLVRAIALHDEGRTEEARSVLEELVADEPQHARAIWNLGLLAMSDEEHDRAIECFERAIAIDEQAAEYHLWRGYAYAAKVETAFLVKKPFIAAKILRSFERAVELAPKNIKARKALMSFYLEAPPIVGGSQSRAAEQAETIRRLEQ